ncbi:MAG: LLM class flavin-dependent oxidoreductase, partial [Acetobacteraceae bacterium]|nr:LLM class flavin-dependent oxidoreductase [Acetobacteraceae bacterium]
WEGSWAGDAVRRDRAAGVYADPARVRAVRRPGLEAIHLVEPSPQRTPVLYQAGASDRGRDFAARHAECVFLNASSKANVARLVADLRARAAPRELRIFVGATLVVGRTAAQARDLLEEYRRHVSVEGALAQSAGSLGIDFARFGLDEPVSGESNAVTSNIEGLNRVLGPGWTKRQLVDSFVLGSRQAPIVGSGAEVAEALIGWVEETGVDGFNLSRTVMPECIEAVVDLVVPELQARGRYKRGYAPGTYREKLFGAGPLLAAPHPAAGVRW